MSVLAKANAVREHIVKLEGDLKGCKAELASIERQCRHRWSEPKYTPEHREGYRIAGDPVGTMGVDWRGPMDVPPQTIKKWTRTCQECGKVEVTERTTTEKTEHPAF
jgi:hypothetical protein